MRPIALAIVATTLSWMICSCSHVAGISMLAESPKATPYDCSESCSSIRLRLIIRNRTDLSYCFSNSSLEEFSSNYMSVKLRRTGQKQVQVSEIGMPIPDNNYSKMRLATLDSNHVVISPGETLLREVHADKKFDLHREPSELTFRLLVFPCVEADFNALGAKWLGLEVPIKF